MVQSMMTVDQILYNIQGTFNFGDLRPLFSIQDHHLHNEVKPGTPILLNDGAIELEVKGIEQSHYYGATTFTGYLPDTFGHSQDIPAILGSNEK